MVFGHSLLSSTQDWGNIKCDDYRQTGKTSSEITFVIGYCESDVLWDNTILLHEAGQDAGLLQHLGNQVLENCCQVDWGQFSDPGNIWWKFHPTVQGVVCFLPVTLHHFLTTNSVDLPDREEQTSSGRSRSSFGLCVSQSWRRRHGQLSMSMCKMSFLEVESTSGSKRLLQFGI